jgi:putative phage-type endonuclease
MARLVVNTKGMAHEEWLKNRDNGIGGSDAAAIAGASQYKSPVMVYMEKMGLYKQEVSGESAYWGNTLEAVVRKEFIKRYNAEIDAEYKAEGIKLYKSARVQQRHAIFAHDEHDFMRANVDGLIFCPRKGLGIFEAKTANQFLSDEWAGDDVPNQYYIQVQHYMAVMGLSYAYIAVLIGAQKYKHYYIERDEEFITYLINIESNFWNNHILTKIPPEMSGLDAEKSMLTSLYPNSYEPETPLQLSNEACIWLDKVEEYKNAEKVAKESKTKYENMIKDELKEVEVAFAGPHKITWKTAKNGQRRFTYKLGKVEVVK